MELLNHTVICGFGGDSAYTLLKKKTIKRGEKGVWQRDDDFKKTQFIYFSCPDCAGIQKIHKDAIFCGRSPTSMAGSDGKIYQSIWCRNHKCAKHLWLRFGP